MLKLYERTIAVLEKDLLFFHLWNVCFAGLLCCSYCGEPSAWSIAIHDQWLRDATVCWLLQKIVNIQAHCFETGVTFSQGTMEDFFLNKCVSLVGFTVGLQFQITITWNNILVPGLIEFKFPSCCGGFEFLQIVNLGLFDDFWWFDKKCHPCDHVIHATSV